MKFLTPSLLILACFVMGGMIFKSATPTHCGPIRPNDHVFVLTGDARRIPFAMRQIRKVPRAQLYIIGAGANGLDETMGRAIIESESKSTYQNAQAIRKIVHKNNLRRIVLVTTEDHMNRARFLVASELPDTEIAVCVARLAGMPAPKRLERWTTEYVKYIVTMFGIKES